MKTLSLVLSVILVLSSSLHAGPGPDAVHLVSIEDLKSEISAGNSERAGNIREVLTLLQRPEVQDLGRHFDLEKIEAAIPALDDDTLARLADESARVNEQFRAGDSEPQCGCDLKRAVALWTIFWGSIVAIVAIAVLG
ncbi:MAG: hypothetical protein OXH11_14010 [Candidatus Aminicenantes bacterium]|nr:hypothetical protein [Candidatus Aminicenantes bacterium]